MVKNGKYNLANNLVYMWRMHWNFDKLFLGLILLQVIFHFGGSLLTVVLPKVVLDGISEHGNLQALVLKISAFAGLLAFLKAGDKKVQVSLDEHAWKFFYFAGYENINTKRMEMDYSLYTSPKGKTAAQKALMSVSGYTFSSVVAFFLYWKDLAVNLLGFTSYSAILMTLNPWIILFLLASYIINSTVALAIERTKHQLRDEEANIARKKRYFAQQTSLVQYAKDIRIYSLSGWLRELRQRLLQEELHFNSREQRRTFAQWMIQGLLVLIRDGFTYTYLIYCVMNDSQMSIGMFSLYLGAITGFGDWLSELVEGVQGLAEANNYVKDYREFMDIDAGDEAAVEENSCTLTEPIKNIRFEHVSYCYPGSDKMVLEDICLDIRGGENVALVGVNGAGKSTLVKLLCGLLKPTSGEIYLNGTNISRIKREALAEQFGVMFQNLNILPMSIARNITFCDELSGQEEARLWQALESAGIALRVKSLPAGINTPLMKQFNQDGVDLSGGELQKLLLARALYRNAPILVLDEPTAALDPIAENELYLKYHALTRGKTSLYISHRLSSTAFCDRIIVLDGARIVESGTHDQLMRRQGLYANLFAASGKYYKEEGAQDV